MPKVEVQSNLPQQICRIEPCPTLRRRVVVITAPVIQKLLDRDCVAARIQRVREAKERINLCVRWQLLGIVEGLNCRLKEHLAAANEEKAVGRQGGPIARFGPRISARKL